MIFALLQTCYGCDGGPLDPAISWWEQYHNFVIFVVVVLLLWFMWQMRPRKPR